jgi:hypothetical protein
MKPMMNRAYAALTASLLALTFVSCVRVKAPASHPSAPVPGASMWTQPTDLAKRDLYYGPWGRERAPDPKASYTFVERKHTGVNPGMTVRDPQGREWSVKQAYPGGMDFEGQTEVALSRLLSAVGYHQPPVYYVPTFTLKDDWGTHTEPGGRFRLDEPTLKSAGAWAWGENPFIGTKPYQGLLVLMMMFNATDLKTSNNSIYERKDGDLVEQWYVARDIGSALGDWSRIAPRKGHAATFERQPFILGVNGRFVDFAYTGWYHKLVRNRITPDEVAWASNLLAQLSDQQWRDAFRAGGYEPEVANRFITTLKKKVSEGRDLTRRTAATSAALQEVQ